MQLRCTGPGLVQAQQFAGIAVKAGGTVADLADTAGLRLQGGQFGGLSNSICTPVCKNISGNPLRPAPIALV